MRVCVCVCVSQSHELARHFSFVVNKEDINAVEHTNHDNSKIEVLHGLDHLQYIDIYQYYICCK